ncbi:hypothetical protein B9Z19DRAFT_1065829 [Tuber borchii]|uniref:Uncharacterized protein n=1 Tax=Tuber borchii TaxID=42251 RepID=A0A2T6ZPR5_TUBBO|nr:hypothetical protein B9Z19DRAFT_1065829 [Tuber borchii]
MATRSWYTNVWKDIIRDLGGPATTVLVGGAAIIVEGLAGYRMEQLRAGIREYIGTRDSQMIEKFEDSQKITLATVKVMAAHHKDCKSIEARIAAAVDGMQKGGGGTDEVRRVPW